MKEMRSFKRQGGWITLAAAGLGAAASIFGAKKASKAAKKATNTQAAAIDRATAETRRASEQARADLSPFVNAGAGQIDNLNTVNNQQRELLDPNNQVKYVKDNPFYAMLADDAKNKIFNNQAAKGKLGSGGTAEALQNSLLLLGEDLINNQFNRQSTVISNTGDMVRMGANAAAGQGNIAMNSGNNVANLMTNKGDVQASGIVGSANAITGGIDNLINAGLGAYDIYSQGKGAPVLEYYDTSKIPARR